MCFITMFYFSNSAPHVVHVVCMYETYGTSRGQQIIQKYFLNYLLLLFME